MFLLNCVEEVTLCGNTECHIWLCFMWASDDRLNISINCSIRLEWKTSPLMKFNMSENVALKLLLLSQGFWTAIFVLTWQIFFPPPFQNVYSSLNAVWFCSQWFTMYDRPACRSVWGYIPPVSMWHWPFIKNHDHDSLWWNYFFLFLWVLFLKCIQCCLISLWAVWTFFLCSWLVWWDSDCFIFE